MKILRRVLLLVVLLSVIAAWLATEAVRWSLAEPENYSRIEEGLYLGGDVARPPRGVKAVLNLCETEDPYRAEVHVWEPIRDAAPAPSLDWLRKRVDFIAENRRAGRPVLVHCHAGVSRGGMVTTAYLMSEHGLTCDEALQLIRAQRPQVRPNPAFMELLLQWEEELKTPSSDKSE